MAIYQFYAAVFPKKGIVEYFGEIPNKLETNFQTRTENFLNFQCEDESDYFEFIQHKCWDFVETNAEEIISQIDQKLDRATWGNDKDSANWKTATEDVDNDAWILKNQEQNQIMEFTFRADLRQPKLKFLTEMIEIAKGNDLLLMDEKGNLVEPEIQKVFELIEKSNAYKFVTNPLEFLEGLHE